MNSLHKALSILLLVCFILSLPLSAIAVDPFHTGREGRWQFSIAPTWYSDEDVSFNDGSTMRFQDEVGFAFGVGYHFTDNLEGNLNFDWSSADYDLDTVDIDGAPVRVVGKLDTSRVNIGLTYNLFDEPLTPLITGHFGSAYLDSNIPSGPSRLVCFRHPWWGLRCGVFTPTYGKWATDYGIGVGVRWEIDENFYFKGIVGNTWTRYDDADTASFVNGRLEFGVMF